MTDSLQEAESYMYIIIIAVTMFMFGAHSVVYCGVWHVVSTRVAPA